MMLCEVMLFGILLLAKHQAKLSYEPKHGDHRLKCVITEKKQQNVVVGHASKMIANDLK